MAGIGFNLDRFLRAETFLAVMGAYVAAALLFAGPWILSVVAMLTLRAIALGSLETPEVDFFMAVLGHSYAFSLILTGLTYLVFVRGLYDRLYAGNFEAVWPLYSWANMVNGGLHLIVASAFWFPQGIPMTTKMWCIGLFVSAGLSWQALAFLGCLTRYGFVLSAFAVGYSVAVVLGALLSKSLGVDGLLLGFTCGVMLAFAAISGKLAADFRKPGRPPGEWLQMKVYPALIGVGFFYNLGLWADRIAFWLFHSEARPAGPLVTYPPYELAVLLAYLTVIPGQALIVIRLELAFFSRYRAFFSSVSGRAGLSVIRRRRKALMDSLQLSFARIVTVQGSITLVLLFAAPYIIEALAIPRECLYMFRVAAVAALLNVIVQGVVMVALYLVLYRLALVTSASFCLLQLAGAWITIQIGFPAFGFGYMGACLLTLVITIPLLVNRIRHLEYYTFAARPVLPET